MKEELVFKGLSPHPLIRGKINILINNFLNFSKLLKTTNSKRDRVIDLPLLGNNLRPPLLLILTITPTRGRTTNLELLSEIIIGVSVLLEERAITLGSSPGLDLEIGLTPVDPLDLISLVDLGEK